MGRGRGRGRDCNGSTSPDPPTPTGKGRGRGRGRGRDTGGDPVTFPNCRYSISSPPPFTGEPQGPTFRLRDPGNANAYIYLFLSFSMISSFNT